MVKNTAIKDFISFLPMPALIIDANGFIVDANLIYKEKFKFNRISKSNKIRLQTFFTFDIENILKSIFTGKADYSNVLFIDI